MPAKSKSQQRLFGMVDAYQKGELDNASKEVKDIAKDISHKDARDFAKTKHKGLPNKVKKTKNESIRISADRLDEMIKESIKKYLKESTNNSKVMNAWFEIQENMGCEQMNEAIFKALGHDTIVKLVRMFIRDYEIPISIDIDEIF